VKKHQDDQLNRRAGKTLLGIARAAVRAEVEKTPVEYPEIECELERPGGAFVTLRRGDELRGCIGTLESTTPLWQTVEHVARQAATVDYRFDPVQAPELPEITFEISVLSPLERIPEPKDPSRIEIGRDGLCIRYKGRSGVLLPQVASSRGWSATEFLEQTCRKAGVRPETWRKPEAELFRFTAEVFDEHSLNVEY